jgi:hypothetical protein
MLIALLARVLRRSRGLRSTGEAAQRQEKRSHSDPAQTAAHVAARTKGMQTMCIYCGNRFEFQKTKTGQVADIHHRATNTTMLHVPSPTVSVNGKRIGYRLDIDRIYPGTSYDDIPGGSNSSLHGTATMAAIS